MTEDLFGQGEQAQLARAASKVVEYEYELTRCLRCI